MVKALVLDKGMCEKCDDHILMKVTMDYVFKHSSNNNNLHIIMNKQQIKHGKHNTTRQHSFKDQTISHSSKYSRIKWCLPLIASLCLCRWTCLNITSSHFALVGHLHMFPFPLLLCIMNCILKLQILSPTV